MPWDRAREINNVIAIADPNPSEPGLDQALIETYRYEKNIVCAGLFMDNRLVQYSNIFNTTPYDTAYHFVHIMQTLGHISFEESDYPLEPCLVKDNEYLHAYDFVYLRNIYGHMTDFKLHPHHRAKHQGTWQMLRTKSPGLLDVFVQSGLNPCSISNFDWTEPMRRVGTPDGFHG